MRTHRLMELEILTISLTAFLVLLLQNGWTVESFGYSYSRFIGPVRGPERQIIVHDRYDGRGRVDYVARPEYHFAYGVEDAKTRVLQNRRETRNGDAVKGVYSVVDPDGSLRVVKYTADNVNGFQAEVISNGVSRIHGQDNLVMHPPPTIAADDNQVNAKDDNNPPDHHHQVEVHANGQEDAGGKKNPVAEEDANDESSDTKDASDYDEEDSGDDGGKSANRNETDEREEDSDEEVEDY